MKLSKADQKRKQDLVDRIRAERDRLEDAARAFNEAVDKAAGPLEAATNKYNEALDEARTFAEEIAGDIESHYDDKSERWQEGERGQAVQEMLGEWQGFEAEDVEVHRPEEYEPGGEHAADALESLPEEAAS
jgi:hypothetical protein